MRKNIFFVCLVSFSHCLLAIEGLPENSDTEQLELLATPPVVICLDSETEWPPYYYHPKNSAGEIDRTRHVGASIDLIARIFEYLDKDYELRQMPWPRVLAAMQGIEGTELCEIGWDMSVNEDRLSWLLFTEPIYKIQSGGFYNKEKLPNLKSFWGLAQLFSYKICGIRGYDYSPVDSMVSIRVAREQQALDLLMLERCDVFLSTIEPIVYGAELGLYQVDPSIHHIVGKGFDRVMHATVSLASPRAQDLHRQLSQALAELRGSGEIEQIFKKYLPGGTGF